MRKVPTGKPFDVVGFGFNTFDHVCVAARPLGFDRKERLERYFTQPGGQIPTALVALQRWGMRTAYVGPLAADEGGRLQRESLAAEGVDLRGVVARPGLTSHTSFVFVDGLTGERTIAWHRPAGLGLRAGELDRALLTAGRVLFLDADDADTAIVAAGWARESGTLVVLDVDRPDPATPRLLERTDALVVSAGFIEQLCGSDLRRGLREASRMGPPTVIATLGGGGALALFDGRVLHQPAPRVPVADTTSAGDVFHAGFLYGLLRGWEPRRTLHFATTAAALECSGPGGRAAIPSLERVMTQINRADRAP